ncbi:MAG TPA: LysM peptidoglycan-binding domain-containing protein, partial [Anaerolineales bacterium]
MSAKKFFQFLLVAALLAASFGLVPAARANAACGNTYTVQRGDTLRKIAARCITSVNALTRANPQIKNANLIFTGQLLMLPGAIIAGTGSFDTYIVDRGDTLNKLANRFGTTVKKLMELNTAITNASVIFEGQRLLVPSVSIPNTGGQVYTVQPGDTLNKIAARFHTTVDAIMKVNTQIKN